MNQKLMSISGLFLIILGVILLLPQFFQFDFKVSIYWPLSIGILGLMFFVTYFVNKDKQPVLLFFGLLMVSLCATFLYSTMEGWHVWTVIAPAPLFAIALSLYLTYVIDRKHSYKILVTSITLGALSLLAFFILAIVFNETIWLGSALIISGVLLPLYVLIERIKRAKSEEIKSKKKT